MQETTEQEGIAAAAALMGKIGGSKKSKAKTIAARANAGKRKRKPFDELTPSGPMLPAATTYADRIFDALRAECDVQEKLDEFWPDLVVSVGVDHYDRSIEIYFSKHSPVDLVITESQVRQIFSWGFHCGWLNFQDGTEQAFSSYDGNLQQHGVFIRQRKAPK